MKSSVCGFVWEDAASCSRAVHLWTLSVLFFPPLHASRFIFRVLLCSIKSLSDARLDLQQSERSGQIQHHISFEQLPVVACGWALSVSVFPAAPNYRQQWHHTVSGLSAEIMLGPIPGVRAPVRVSGFFCVCLQPTSDGPGAALIQCIVSSQCPAFGVTAAK